MFRFTLLLVFLFSLAMAMIISGAEEEVVVVEPQILSQSRLVPSVRRAGPWTPGSTLAADKEFFHSEDADYDAWMAGRTALLKWLNSRDRNAKKDAVADTDGVSVGEGSGSAHGGGINTEITESKVRARSMDRQSFVLDFNVTQADKVLRVLKDVDDLYERITRAERVFSSAKLKDESSPDYLFKTLTDKCFGHSLIDVSGSPSQLRTRSWFSLIPFPMILNGDTLALAEREHKSLQLASKLLAIPSMPPSPPTPVRNTTESTARSEEEEAKEDGEVDSEGSNTNNGEDVESEDGVDETNEDEVNMEAEVEVEEDASIESEAETTTTTPAPPVPTTLLDDKLTHPLEVLSLSKAARQSIYQLSSPLFALAVSDANSLLQDIIARMNANDEATEVQRLEMKYLLKQKSKVQAWASQLREVYKKVRKASSVEKLGYDSDQVIAVGLALIAQARLGCTADLTTLELLPRPSTFTQITGLTTDEVDVRQPWVKKYILALCCVMYVLRELKLAALHGFARTVTRTVGGQRRRMSNRVFRFLFRLLNVVEVWGPFWGPPLLAFYAYRQSSIPIQDIYALVHPTQRVGMLLVMLVAMILSKVVAAAVCALPSFIGSPTDHHDRRRNSQDESEKKDKEE